LRGKFVKVKKDLKSLPLDCFRHLLCFVRETSFINIDSYGIDVFKLYFSVLIAVIFNELVKIFIKFWIKLLHLLCISLILLHGILDYILINSVLEVRAKIESQTIEALSLVILKQVKNWNSAHFLQRVALCDSYVNDRIDII
jgi:hypothetical protein